MKFLPVPTKSLVDIDVLVRHAIGRAFNLYVAARAKIYILALWQIDDELLYESRYVVIGAHGAFPLVDAENIFRDADPHVLIDINLAGQPHTQR